MELRVLKYFLTVAGEENFTKAAKQLHLTQPTLSRQIAQLESELNVRLFVRTNHKVTLTEDGIILRQRAKELLGLAEKTKTELSVKKKELSGTVSIGCGEFLSTRILTDCISEFHKKYKQVKFEIHSGNAETICEKLDCGLLDLGLVSDMFVGKSYDSLTCPVKEQWGVFVNESSELWKNEFVTPDDLCDKKIVFSLGKTARSLLSKWLGSNAERVSVVARGNLLYNEACLGQSGIGPVVGIRLNCTYEGLKFIPFSPVLESGTSLIYKNDRIFSAASGEFLIFLRQYLKSIVNNNI